MPAVNVCDFKTATDAFIKTADAHTGRIRSYVTDLLRGKNGLLFSDGPEWQEQRRFSLHVLRNFGVGRNLMQERIIEEVQYCFGLLDKKFKEHGKKKLTFSPAKLFDPLVGSIINKMLAGFGFEEFNMHKFYELKHSLDHALGENSIFDTALLSSKTKNLPYFKQRIEMLSKPTLTILGLLKKLVEKRKTQIADGTYVLDDTQPNDYIDAYLSEMERRKKQGEPMGSFTEECLTINLLDLWIAGMETTILTLCWALIYILNNPDVQEKARKEILEATGGNRFVELADKKDLHYLNAVITEVQRHASILNFNLWHRTTTKIMVGDYLIPENVTIAPQISVIMSNEEEFKDPYKFDPERFMDGKHDQHVIPFSIGKRSCLGEGLARAELFLVLGNFLQTYKISVPEGQNPPSTKPLSPFGTMHRYRPFECCFEKIKDIDE
ncbi:hypothetical protein L596_029335 [Steinernema carpocapsae]|uniref:Cytochrome P450 n=1 Tax=Steinernema carpocapsae TaxID=34508 RepID=A0A4U5LUB8_STECR|nr:hypothetical protein L596_029335 [Steinernema carpocapsae]